MNVIGEWLWQDLEETTSTNDAVKIWNAELNQPCLVTAKRQSKARGRRGRSWISEEGNLFMSFAYQAQLHQLGHLVILSGLAVWQTVKHFCPEADIKVKWPNDVLAEGGKISGILFERGENDYWIMGIGINVVSHPEKQATGYGTASLFSLGARTDRLCVLKQFIAEWDTLLQRYRVEGFLKLKQSWLDKALNLGQKVKIRQEKEIKEGIFKNLADDGSLWLQSEKGIEKIIVGDLFV